MVAAATIGTSLIMFGETIVEVGAGEVGEDCGITVAVGWAGVDDGPRGNDGVFVIALWVVAGVFVGMNGVSSPSGICVKMGEVGGDDTWQAVSIKPNNVR